MEYQNLEYLLTHVYGNKQAPLDHPKPTKVVIDCDTGADDGQAIILALYLAKQIGC